MNGSPGNIFAFLTGTSVKFVGAEGDYIECHGWVDPNWSRTELFTNRNYATPVLNEPYGAEDLEELITDALSIHLGVWHNNGDGSFYGEDTYQEAETGTHWTYALHFIHKYRDAAGRWVEESWNPSEAGITL